jgi:hypothetical protein
MQLVGSQICFGFSSLSLVGNAFALSLALSYQRVLLKRVVLSSYAAFLGRHWTQLFVLKLVCGSVSLSRSQSPLLQQCGVRRVVGSHLVF